MGKLLDEGIALVYDCSMKPRTGKMTAGLKRKPKKMHGLSIKKKKKQEKIICLLACFLYEIIIIHHVICYESLDECVCQLMRLLQS